MKKSFKQKFSNYTTLGSRYKEEFRNQLRMFIHFTLGFTIAFTWREYLFESSKNFIKWLTGTTHSGAFGASIFITLLCVFLIFLTSYYLKEKNRI